MQSLSVLSALTESKYLSSFIVFLKAPWSTGQIQNTGLSGQKGVYDTI